MIGAAVSARDGSLWIGSAAHRSNYYQSIADTNVQSLRLHASALMPPGQLGGRASAREAAGFLAQRT